MGDLVKFPTPAADVDPAELYLRLRADRRNGRSPELSKHERAAVEGWRRERLAAASAGWLCLRCDRLGNCPEPCAEVAALEAPARTAGELVQFPKPRRVPTPKPTPAELFDLAADLLHQERAAGRNPWGRS